MAHATPHHHLTKELQTFAAKREHLLAQHAGKFALIKGADVVNVFDTERDAVLAGYAQFGLSSFLVKRISATDEEVQISSVLAGLHGA